jgi:hypothetical protein
MTCSTMSLALSKRSPSRLTLSTMLRSRSARVIAVGPTPWRMSTIESRRTSWPDGVRTISAPMSSAVRACSGRTLIHTSYRLPLVV